MASDFLGNIVSQSKIVACKSCATVEYIYLALPLLMSGMSVISKEPTMILQRCAVCPHSYLHCCDGKMPHKKSVLAGWKFHWNSVCMCFLELPKKSATKQVAGNNRNLFFYSF